MSSAVAPMSSNKTALPKRQVYSTFHALSSQPTSMSLCNGMLESGFLFSYFLISQVHRSPLP
jgi:hypothetical protein